MKKKVISPVLCLVLCLGLVPAVFAADAQPAASNIGAVDPTDLGPGQSAQTEPDDSDRGTLTYTQIIAPRYEDAAGLVSRTEIMNGVSDNCFSPQESCTCEQAWIRIYRLYQLVK